MKKCVALAAVLAAAGAAFGQTFSNPAPMTVGTTAAPADLYPSSIAVAGLGGNIIDLTVTLHNVSHTWPDDIDVLLVGPGGQTVMLVSDAGGSTDVVGATLSFNNSAAGMIPDGGPMVSGTYLPSDYVTGDIMPAPAPAGPYGSSLAAFFGTDGNGTWNLFFADDAGADAGAIAGGWSIDFVVPAPGTAALLGLGGVMAFRRRR